MDYIKSSSANGLYDEYCNIPDIEDDITEPTDKELLDLLGEIANELELLESESQDVWEQRWTEYFEAGGEF